MYEYAFQELVAAPIGRGTIRGFPLGKSLEKDPQTTSVSQIIVELQF